MTPFVSNFNFTDGMKDLVLKVYEVFLEMGVPRDFCGPAFQQMYL